MQKPHSIRLSLRIAVMLLFMSGVTQVLISPVRAQQRETRTRLHFHGQHPFPQDPRHVPSKPRPPVTVVRFRSIDGRENNAEHPAWGAVGNHLRRMAPAVYSDGFNAMAGSGRLSAREISNLVFDQIKPRFNRRNLSSMVWQWGQFLDHDIVLTHSAEPLEVAAIAVPAGDIFFDPFATGDKRIGFFRSEYGITTGVNRPRQQVNFITAWVDGSNIYGSDDQTANQLRTFVQGKLKTSAGDLLPQNVAGFFMAGDIRANEQVGLTSLHTLFVREHNRIAAHYHAIRPHYNDEQIYLRARKLVIAQIQAISFREFLPALLGKHPLRPYRGYRSDVSPKIINGFATAAYRMGHSMLPAELEVRLPAHPFEEIEFLALKDAFFNPLLIQANGIEPYLLGLCHQTCQELDTFVVDDVRNFLFGNPGAGGFDLAALNIQRGRDHGLPDYNALRVAAGLPPALRFQDITSNPELVSKLQMAYEFNIDDVDSWVGMLAEDHLPGTSTGPTVRAILQQQFEALRDGDRFWYERHLNSTELVWVNQSKLADVITRNTLVAEKHIPQDVFRVEGKR